MRPASGRTILQYGKCVLDERFAQELGGLSCGWQGFVAAVAVVVRQAHIADFAHAQRNQNGQREAGTLAYCLADFHEWFAWERYAVRAEIEKDGFSFSYDAEYLTVDTEKLGNDRAPPVQCTIP